MAEKKDDKETKPKGNEKADDAGDDEEEDESADSENTGASSETKPKDETIPRARLNEEINKRKASDKKLADLEKAQREREEADATAKGEFKALADQRGARIVELEAEVAKLKERAERADALEASIRTSFKSRVDALPTEIKELAPMDLETASPESLEKWLPSAEKLAKKLGGNGADDGGEDDGKGKQNGSTSRKKEEAKRGAGPSPKPRADDKARGELVERARRSQQGFTLTNF